MSESYYPSHASLPVERLTIVSSRASSFSGAPHGDFRKIEHEIRKSPYPLELTASRTAIIADHRRRPLGH